MRSVLRSAGAVVAGFVAASVVMMIVEFVNGHVLYPDLGRAAARHADREELRALLAAAPVGAFLVVLAGWILGGFVGGFVAARLAGQSPSGHALALGVLLTLAGVANNLMIPPPVWFWIVGLVVLVPATCAGARLVGRH